MGTCCGGNSTQKRYPLSADQRKVVNDANMEIGLYISESVANEKKVKKLLLLGSGSSGKSTLFKQIKIIHGQSFDEPECVEVQHAIRSNCVLGILTLLKKSEHLSNVYGSENNDEKDMNEDDDIEIITKDDTYDDIKDTNNVQTRLKVDSITHSSPENTKTCNIYISHFIDGDSCKIDLENEITVNHIRTILHFSNESFENMNGVSANALEALGIAINAIWNLPCIRNTFEYKQYYSIIENLDYFFDKILEVMNHGFYPSMQDVLRCRIRTTGIVKEVYEIEHEGKQIHLCMVDVGGQRTERKKWIHSFENVTAVIFVAALNHYCTVLFEDETVNGMQESLLLFDEICNSKWFRKTAMILFLNKNDLFEISIKKCIPLSFCFGNEYHGLVYKPKGVC